MKSLSVFASLALKLGLVFGVPGCSFFRMNSYDSAGKPVLAALFTIVQAGGPDHRFDPATGCVAGVRARMDSALPSWIRDNFKCATGMLSGENIVLISQNLPNHAAPYYGEHASLHEIIPAGNGPVPDGALLSQSYVYTIPLRPEKNPGTPVATQGGLSSVGMTRNGRAIFNAAGEPGEVLAEEARASGGINGYSERSRAYHHHEESPALPGSDANLVGVALDGFPIYGLHCNHAARSTHADATPGDGSPPLDAFHGHVAPTAHFPAGRYHYHYAYDETANRRTLMGSFFYGKIGTVTK